jgi:hypothetical protein
MLNCQDPKWIADCLEFWRSQLEHATSRKTRTFIQQQIAMFEAWQAQNRVRA